MSLHNHERLLSSNAIHALWPWVVRAIFWSGALNKGPCSVLEGANRVSKRRFCLWRGGERSAQIVASSTALLTIRGVGGTCRPELLVSQGRRHLSQKQGVRGMGGGGRGRNAAFKGGNSRGRKQETDNKWAKWTGARDLSPSPCKVVYSQKFKPNI